MHLLNLEPCQFLFLLIDWFEFNLPCIYLGLCELSLFDDTLLLALTDEQEQLIADSFVSNANVDALTQLLEQC